MRKKEKNDESWRVPSDENLFEPVSVVVPSIESMWMSPLRDDMHLWLEDAVDDFLLEVAQDVYQGELPLDEAERRFRKRVRFVLRKICKNVKFDFNRFIEEN